MKCEDCGFLIYEGANVETPYPHTWCSKGHWKSGPPTGIATEETLENWHEDCKEFRHAHQPEF